MSSRERQWSLRWPGTQRPPKLLRIRRCHRVSALFSGWEARTSKPCCGARSVRGTSSTSRASASSNDSASTVTDWLAEDGLYSRGEPCPVSRRMTRGAAHASSRARSRSATASRIAMSRFRERGGLQPTERFLRRRCCSGPHLRPAAERDGALPLHRPQSGLGVGKEAGLPLRLDERRANRRPLGCLGFCQVGVKVPVEQGPAPRWPRARCARRSACYNAPARPRSSVG